MMSLISSIFPPRRGADSKGVPRRQARAAGRFVRSRARRASRDSRTRKTCRRAAPSCPDCAERGRWHSRCYLRQGKESAVMKCADIMSKNLEWLNEKDTIRQAAAIMADAGVGFLPICDKWKKVIGVVTD